MPKPALTYLTRRGSVYWFRMAVPKDLVGRVGCREIKGSLRTRSPAIARLRCQRLGSVILQLIARVHSMPELSQETIKRLDAAIFRAATKLDRGVGVLDSHGPCRRSGLRSTR